MPSTSTLILSILILLSAIHGGASRGPFACDPNNSATTDYPFCRRSLGVGERVKDLIGRLTLEEKVKLLVSNAGGVPRLGIKAYQWWSEALHGVSNVGPGTSFGGEFPAATSFPQVISTVASFNASLWEAIGRVVSDEARAMYNGGVGGLTYWSPNVNIFRDPRWGRGQETPGEDPILAGTYAVNYVRGLQGTEGNRLKVAACCKHFTAYDLDNWNGVDRFHFNAQVSKQDIEDTFEVPFRMCVEGGKVSSVMCSYNQVNGVPTCADPNLLTNTLRSQWHLDGYIVSDCDSVGVFYDSQHYTSTPEEAAAMAIKAGLDLDCGPFLETHTENAVKRGILNESHINGALSNTLSVQMRLGMFDGDLKTQPFAHLGAKHVCSDHNRQLAVDAARQGIVLLENRRNSLPLSTYHHRIVAVVGPNSNATLTMIGNYAGIACEYITPLQGISKYTRTIHQQGCKGVACRSNKYFGGAIEAAREADAVVLVMGLDQSIEAEFRDRAELLLPGLQPDLVLKVASMAKGPVILVLMSGGPIDVSFAKDHPKISGIIWAGYPGQAGGLAIADVLFGRTNPGGKLPMTWYPQDYVSKLPMTTMSLRPGPSYPGRTYRFYKGPVVYPFGHGLSYTTFTHKILAAPTTLTVPVSGHRHRQNATEFSGKAIRVTHAKCERLSLVIKVAVRNIGGRDGAHTLLVYSRPPMGVWAPQKQLVAFEKVHVEAQAQKEVEINIHVCKFLSVVDKFGIRRVAMGEHGIDVGDVRHIVSLQPQTLGIIKS
ncbi:hypothetical protein IC582_017462 [Cucumis melo]|uniref:Probable beta-D-xylosidase 2 isoform X1 n=1 Tax=Cucumis melo TaxID=3656 RepID=A0A1S3BZ20_CUCME|nr:probable beta-D-xylosidase 2 isoform X1 [Cucumis melo]